MFLKPKTTRHGVFFSKLKRNKIRKNKKIKENKENMSKNIF